jgi:hypothetical protein
MKPEHAPLIPLMAGTVDGTAFSVHGTGEPLVLVHGVGMGKEIWTPQIAAFSRIIRSLSTTCWGMVTVRCLPPMSRCATMQTSWRAC